MKEIKIDKDLFSTQQKGDTKSLLTGTLKKIVVKKFWDSHGKDVDWGKDEINYNDLVDFEIIEKTMVMKSKYLPDYEYTNWYLKINGEDKDLQGEICGYSYNENNHTLRIKLCIGAG